MKKSRKGIGKLRIVSGSQNSDEREPFFCIVFIKPVPKGRPRFTRGGVYTPKKTRDFQNHLKSVISQVYTEEPMWGELAVSLDFGRKRKVTATPDLDNYVKSVCDALNGVLWEDDSQITELYASKQLSQDAFIKIRVDPIK